MECTPSENEQCNEWIKVSQMNDESNDRMYQRRDFQVEWSREWMVSTELRVDKITCGEWENKWHEFPGTRNRNFIVNVEWKCIEWPKCQNLGRICNNHRIENGECSIEQHRMTRMYCPCNRTEPRMNENHIYSRYHSRNLYLIWWSMNVYRSAHEDIVGI